MDKSDLQELDLQELDLQELFCEWPIKMPRRGILITSQGEQIPFSGFLTQQRLLLIERNTPDAMGSRIVILPYRNIAGVKLADVISPKLFTELGFAGSLSPK